MKRNCFFMIYVLLVWAMMLPQRVFADTPLLLNDYSWMERIRPEHPRMFLTVEDLPQIRNTAATFEKATYDAMKKRIDNIIDKPIEFENALSPTNAGQANHQYGFRASESAMLYLITGEPRYLDFTRKLLKKITYYYTLRVLNDLNIDWYVFSQICTLCAYDWIYNDLTKTERESIGRSLFEVMNNIAWHGPGIRAARFRENVSDYQSGCYGVAVLPWYLGLTFYGEGFDDIHCAQMIRNGYDLHQKMTAFRAAMVGEKGGGATACAQYSFGYYPLAEFDLIYTFRSATGIDIAEKLNYIIGYLKYMDWVRLPGNREYGFGDVHHYNCMLPHRDMNLHVAEIANLYGEKHPEIMPVAARLLTKFNQRRPVDGIPFLRLLHKTPPVSNTATACEAQHHSIYFDTMGQVYMRSGTEDDDTYALFVSGGIPTQHKHYDNNNFIIYKHGYRALDSGTRPEPGWHLSHYYARTVAHNCVTIRMPGETMPAYWGGPAACEEPGVPVPNDGGQRELLASELLTLEETEDYVYLASDATKSYHRDKAKLVMREFVYCLPDLFVVFDRVISTKAEYPKSWLFHTAAEPQMISTKEFFETSRSGKTICRTLFPKNAVLEKVGGPDRQFWSDGRNWPLPVLTPEDYGYDQRHITPPSTHPEVGHWRIEVRPGIAAEEDLFMHILQVGDLLLSKLPKTKTFEDENRIGVKFKYNGKTFEITFNKKATHGCDIQVTGKR